eukprot:754828-Hanusia_phi.AAC.2
MPGANESTRRRRRLRLGGQEMQYGTAKEEWRSSKEWERDAGTGTGARSRSSSSSVLLLVA